MNFETENNAVLNAMVACSAVFLSGPLPEKGCVLETTGR
jgi:hypothetical protein